MNIDPERLSVVLATDCGSTTTKAILFEKTDSGWRAAFRGEAPTTVEAPLADVTVGALNAFREVEELSGRRIIRDDFVAKSSDQPAANSPFIFRTDNNPGAGIDLYISTSSAGGGLQMIVLGVVGTMSTESAERAALGAGAIVMDAIACDDGREMHEHVERIRHLRPDICLIAGGTDGGTIDHPVQLAETLLQADPRPRFGSTLKLPVIYAANKYAGDQVRELLEQRFEFQIVDNLRPALERENLAPARDAIHEIFLEHVMSHAPGYSILLSWSPVPIQPTPAAFGTMVHNAALHFSKSILAVDIGGATTDVFSAIIQSDSEQNKQVNFHRSVSANLGMSYSVANVLIEAGVERVRRWLPFSIEPDALADLLRNKMVRPTTIPQTMTDLLIEQAICREALRLSFEHHKRLATGLKGSRRATSIGDLFRQGETSDEFDIKNIDLIIGSGGVLSHAPDRRSAALMMVDAFQPEGITELAVDSVFMMPHLGVLSTVHPTAAAEIFLRDCMVPIGAVVAPRGDARKYAGKPCCSVTLNREPARNVRWGDFVRIPVETANMSSSSSPGTVRVKVVPASSTIDVGGGPGRELMREVFIGTGGVVIDARGRPLPFEQDSSRAQKAALHSQNAMGLSGVDRSETDRPKAVRSQAVTLEADSTQEGTHKTGKQGAER